MTIVTKRLMGWAAFVASVLMIPVIAMQFTDEVKWSLSDFIIMGTLLLSIGALYEVVGRRSKDTIYRISFGLGLLGAFLLLWVNGAVGIIGNEDQDANLLYGAVLGIGFIGALISRFKARGMSITLWSAAAATILVPILAFILWPPPAISWSPGVVRVFMLSGFFAMIFATSAVLFRRSAENENPTSKL